MCYSVRRQCVCGREEAEFMLRDNLLPQEILINLYCPACRDLADWDPENMVEDNGWILEYDLEGARFLMWQRGITQEISPAFLLEEGYFSWNGLTPYDLEERRRLHAELAPLLKQDRLQYLNAIKETMLQYVAGLKAAGWRKAQAA